MFAYVGKFSLGEHAKDELMVVLLPKGCVRAQDHVYIYTSWTKSGAGKVKGPWMNDLIIKSTTTAPNGEDSFAFHASYYTWKGVTKDGYKKLQLTLKYTKDRLVAFTLDRKYQAEDDYTPIIEDVRVWTGRMAWLNNAANEPFMVVTPQGMGPQKDVLTFWQWAEDAAGHKKANSYTVTKQQSAKDTPEIFHFTNYYTLSCIFDKNTKGLTVFIKGPKGFEGERTLKDINQVVHLNAHSHDFFPPKPHTESRTVEPRSPRVEPALDRIHAPIPFPSNLVDTLTHTASSLDQAGHTAKSAVQRYEEPDGSYHSAVIERNKADESVASLKQKASADKPELEKQKSKSRVEKYKNVQREKTLSESFKGLAERMEELVQEYQQIEQYILTDAKKGEAVTNLLNNTQKSSKEEQAARKALQAEIDRVTANLNASLIDIKAKNSVLMKRSTSLEGQLTAEKHAGRTLKRKLNDLTRDKIHHSQENTTAEKRATVGKENYRKLQTESKEQAERIKHLEEANAALTKDYNFYKQFYHNVGKMMDNRTLQ